MRATESWVLWHIGAHGPSTAAALAARLSVEPARLRAVLEALGRRGYVRPDRYGVPDLTATGREALVKLVKRAHGNAGPVRPRLAGRDPRTLARTRISTKRKQPPHVTEKPRPAPVVCHARLCLDRVARDAQAADA